MTDSPRSPLRDDPVLAMILTQDLDGNADDLLRRLRLLGRHKFADQLEMQVLARGGVGPREVAYRLVPSPSVSWFARAVQRIGLRPEPEPRIY
jgi:hypothetical protein